LRFDPLWNRPVSARLHRPPRTQLAVDHRNRRKWISSGPPPKAENDGEPDARGEMGGPDCAAVTCAPSGSCRLLDGVMCIDFTGSAHSKSEVQSACVSEEGVYSPHRCPTTDRIGTCTSNAGSPKEYVTFAYPPVDPVAVEALCTGELHGTWTPGGRACDGNPHGSVETRMRFETQQVSAGTCLGEEQMRVCLNGTWSNWNGTYEYEACSVARPQQCTGAPLGCYSGGPGTCGLQFGCFWNATLNMCSGVPSPCSSFYNMGSCMAQIGCIWG